MAQLRYDGRVLRRVQNGRGTWVRGLCERSHPYYAAFADTLPRWFIELAGNKRMLADLTSPHDVEFYAGRWELTAARLFSNLGFEIEFEPPVQSTVPERSPRPRTSVASDAGCGRWWRCSNRTRAMLRGERGRPVPATEWRSSVPTAAVRDGHVQSAVLPRRFTHPLSRRCIHRRGCLLTGRQQRSRGGGMPDTASRCACSTSACRPTASGWTRASRC